MVGRGLTGDARRAVVAAADAAAARDAFAAVLELSTTPLLVVDPTTGRVLSANDAAWALLRREPDDAAFVLADGLQRGAGAGLAGVVPTGRQRLLVGEGRLDVEITAVPLKDGRGELSTSLVRLDAAPTATTGTEGPAARALHELVRTLTDRVSSELTLAVGHAELALQTADDARTEAVEAVRTHAARATQGVTAVVARSRALLGGRGPTDLPELVGWARRVTADRLDDAGLELTLDHTASAHLPPLDAGLLRQVVLNWLLHLTTGALAEPSGQVRAARLGADRRREGTLVTLAHDGPPVLDAGARALQVTGDLVTEAGGSWELEGNALRLLLPTVQQQQEHTGARPPRTVGLVAADGRVATLVQQELTHGTGAWHWVGHATSVAAGVELLRDAQPDVALVDPGLGDAATPDPLASLRAASPRSRFLMLSTDEPAAGDGADEEELPRLDAFRTLASLSTELEAALQR